MTRRRYFILSSSILTVLLLLVLLVYLIYQATSQPGPTNPSPPELGGQRVPSQIYEIQFDRKYDLFCTFYREEPTTFRNCKILGFTGRGEESSEARKASGSRGFSSFSGVSSYSREYFDHWLVLELADGRKAYVPAGAVKYVEEASPQVK